MQDYEKCVDAGEAWLQEHAPEGFKERLILADQEGQFNLASVSMCVLAHAFPDDIDGDVIPGHYTTVICDHGLAYAGRPESLGFVWESYNEDFRLLQAAWERRIAAWQKDQVPA